MGKVIQLGDNAYAREVARERASELVQILTEATEMEALRELFRSQSFIDKVTEILLTEMQNTQT